MNFVFPLLAWRSCLAVMGLGGLLALEQVAPFKPPVDRKVRRYGRNLSISLANSAILDACLSAVVVAYVGWLGSRRIGLLHWTGLDPAWNAALSIPFLDFSTWVFHKAYHEVPVLWRLHRVHHSDLDLDVTSASRFHIAEIMLSALYRLAVAALWGPTFQALTAFEATLLFCAQVQHSNIKLPGDWDRRLRWVFVTPDMHRVHHSVVRGETNSNYSTVFSVWDRLFASYKVEGIDQDALTIGLPEYRRPDQVTLGKLMLMPLGAGCEAGPPA